MAICPQIRTPKPRWCTVPIQVDDDGTYVEHGRAQYEVVLASPAAYETAMLNVPLHNECENWVGQRVRVGASDAVGTVRGAEFPLRKWKKATDPSEGYQVDVGHLRLSNVFLVEHEICPKFRKNVLLDLEGNTSFETVKDFVAAGNNKGYAMTSVLSLWNAEEQDESTEGASNCN